MIELVAGVLPLVALFQLTDGPSPEIEIVIAYFTHL